MKEGRSQRVRFTVHESTDGRVHVWDDDFGYDAGLQLSGDFAFQHEKVAFAQAVANALNAAEDTIPVRREVQRERIG